MAIDIDDDLVLTGEHAVVLGIVLSMQAGAAMFNRSKPLPGANDKMNIIRVALNEIDEMYQLKLTESISKLQYQRNNQSDG